jgi:hypothetical protein
MKVSGSGANVRMRLEPIEVDVLGEALDDLLGALDDMGPGDPVWERLYPAAFADADAAEEFREMVGEDLDNARRERLSACRGQLAAAPTGRRGTEVVLEPEALQRWLMALNDVRLALGTVLGIGPDDDHRIDPADPQAHQRALYQWLTAVQDGLVTHALR